MKLNCTYKLVDDKSFIEFVNSGTMNTQIVERINQRGGTIRPLKYDKDGDVVAWAYPNGSSSSIAIDDWFISKSEFHYFEKVQEGYPERPIVVDKRIVGDVLMATAHHEDPNENEIFVWNTKRNDEKKVRVSAGGDVIEFNQSQIPLMIGLLQRLELEVK